MANIFPQKCCVKGGWYRPIFFGGIQDWGWFHKRCTARLWSWYITGMELLWLLPNLVDFSCGSNLKPWHETGPRMAGSKYGYQWYQTQNTWGCHGMPRPWFLKFGPWCQLGHGMLSWTCWNVRVHDGSSCYNNMFSIFHPHHIHHIPKIRRLLSPHVWGLAGC